MSPFSWFLATRASSSTFHTRRSLGGGVVVSDQCSFEARELVMMTLVIAMIMLMWML